MKCAEFARDRGFITAEPELGARHEAIRADRNYLIFRDGNNNIIGSAPVLLSSWMFSVACRIGTVYPSSLNRVLTAAASSGVHARISIISRFQRREARRAGPPPRDGYRWPNLASLAKRYRPLTKPKHRSSTVGRSGIERHEDAHATELDRPPTEQP